MLPEFLSVGMGLFNSISNILGSNEEKKKQEEAKRKSIELLNRNYLSNNEIQTRVNEVGNTFNTASMEQLNNQAYNNANLLNPDLIRTLNTAKMASQKAMAQVDTRNKLFNQNENLNAQIAQIEGIPTQELNTGQIIGEALNTGLQAYSTFQGIENQNDYLDTITGRNNQDNINNFNLQEVASSANTLSFNPVRDINNIPNNLEDNYLQGLKLKLPKFPINFGR